MALSHSRGRASSSSPNRDHWSQWLGEVRPVWWVQVAGALICLGGGVAMISYGLYCTHGAPVWHLWLFIAGSIFVYLSAVFAFLTPWPRTRIPAVHMAMPLGIILLVVALVL